MESNLRPVAERACRKGANIVAEVETLFVGFGPARLVAWIITLVPLERRRPLEVDFRIDTNDYLWTPSYAVDWRCLPPSIAIGKET